MDKPNRARRLPVGTSGAAGRLAVMLLSGAALSLLLAGAAQATVST